MADNDDVKDGKKDDKLLAAVVFNPCKSVTYRPIPNKQMVEVTITNNEKTAVIFKWKSTRPGLYKMRPIYGVIASGEKTVVRLFCKGVKEDACPMNDRYTCVCASSPSANVNAENIWSNHKYQKKLAEAGKLRKVKLSIMYQGVNDKATQDVDEDKDEDEKDRVGKIKQKKKDQKSTKSGKPSSGGAASGAGGIDVAPVPVVAGATSECKTAAKKKATVIMCIRGEGLESESDEEDDSDEEKEKNEEGKSGDDKSKNKEGKTLEDKTKTKKDDATKTKDDKTKDDAKTKESKKTEAKTEEKPKTTEKKTEKTTEKKK